MGVERFVPHPGPARLSFEQAVASARATGNVDVAFAKLPEAAVRFAGYSLFVAHVTANRTRPTTTAS